MTDILWNFCAFIVALGILIAVHEFGHFWVARRCGVYVERFSIGFGKALFQRKGKDGTEYMLALIPLGGYVKMLDERVDSVPEERRHLAFNNKPLWQRSAIVAAGPLANFAFAIFAYWVVYLIGIPAIKPVVGEVSSQSIAADAGLRSDMVFDSIDGMKTPYWQSVSMALMAQIGDSSADVMARTSLDAEPKLYHLNLTGWSFDPETENPLTTLGITPFTPPITLVVSQLIDNGAAIQAGFRLNDKIIAIDQDPVTQWQKVSGIIRSHANQALSVTVLRDGTEQVLTLVPQAKTLSNGDVIGYAGIAPKYGQWPAEYQMNLQYGPIESVLKAGEKTWQLVTLTFDMVGKLITGDVGIKNLSGPISIAKGAGMSADFGVVYFLGFLALISVNLGIVNLLPLPVLDGGHLLFFSVEAIMRRPVPERVQDMGYRVGSAILVALMAVALFNDFTRL